MTLTAVYTVAVGTRLAVVVADILLIAFTWYKTFQNRMVGLRVGMRTPLSSLLLRDGMLFFIEAFRSLLNASTITGSVYFM